MAKTPAVVQGREAFALRRWGEAYRLLSVADREAPLEPADLERLAAAAYLVGEDARATAIWTSVHHILVERGHAERAARWGFWISLHLLLASEPAQATG